MPFWTVSDCHETTSPVLFISIWTRKDRRRMRYDVILTGLLRLISVKEVVLTVEVTLMIRGWLVEKYFIDAQHGSVDQKVSLLLSNWLSSFWLFHAITTNPTVQLTQNVEERTNRSDCRLIQYDGLWVENEFMHSKVDEHPPKRTNWWSTITLGIATMATKSKRKQFTGQNSAVDNHKSGLSRRPKIPLRFIRSIVGLSQNVPSPKVAAIFVSSVTRNKKWDRNI